jgi:single-strand DNA-binding protein
MKTISIAGRLTKDAELKRTQSGDPILQFAVAVDDFNGKEKSALFFDVAMFGKRATSLEPLLSKGSSVSVSGDFSTFTADNGKTYLKIRANEVTLQGGKRDGERRRDPPPSSYDDPPEGNMRDDYDDSEIPF